MERISFLKSFMKNGKAVEPEFVEKPGEMKSENSALMNQFAEFEAVLQKLAEIPAAFHKLMPGVDTITQELSDYRERYFLFDELLKDEQNKNNELSTRIDSMKSELERVEYGLQREGAAHGAQRQKNIELEAIVSDLRLTNADLTSRLSRLEPLVRELKITKDTLIAQLDKLQNQKEQSDKEIADFKGELIRLKEQNAKLADKSNSLATERQALSEKLDQLTKTLFEKDNALSTEKEQAAALVTKLKREAIVSRSLKNENDQLIKEREDLRSQADSQIEAARGRYRVLERLLEESRIRYQSESHALNSIRREKSQREYDLVQLNSALSSAKEEITDLRRQILTGSEAISTSGNELSLEIERRRKLEVELDVAREENAKLDAALKSNTVDLENKDLQYDMTISELKGMIEAVRAENERLRIEVEGYRFVDRSDAGSDENDPSGVVISLTR